MELGRDKKTGADQGTRNFQLETTRSANDFHLLVSDHDAITATQAGIAVLGDRRISAIVHVDKNAIGIAFAAVAVAFDGIAREATSHRTGYSSDLASVALADLIAQYPTDDGTQHSAAAAGAAAALGVDAFNVHDNAALPAIALVATLVVFIIVV